ncbi:hypothetical protein SH611_17630 [Geminicoccaceae bacterium 1502E]|nr:hypothetical protein [Geminicoccaceae bacterium 1502E]
MRIADFAHGQRTARDLAGLQERVRTTQIEIASGRRAAPFATAPGEAGAFLRVRDERALTADIAGQNERMVGRLRVMDDAIGRLAGIAEQLQGLLLQRLDDSTGGSMPLAATLDGMLAEATGALNQRFEGAYLFGGSRSERPPVELPAPPLTSPDPALYYQGDGVRLTLRAETGVELSYGVTADERPFAELLAAMGRAGAAHESGDRAGLQGALDLARSALDGILDRRGALAATTAEVEAIAIGQRDLLPAMDEYLARLAEVDPAEAMTRLAADMTSLEAAYLASSRTARLSLADYLR